MYQLYNLLLLMSTLFLVPYYLFLGVRHGKSRRGIRERLGYYTREQLDLVQNLPVIWIHAVSVGEARAALPLIKALRRDYPDHRMVMTNVTETGHATALENPLIDVCLFFPFDFSWTVRKALEQVQPRLILIVETEIWPNFIREAWRKKIPMILVNGRLSDRSFPRYKKARLLLKPILQRITFFCMQSQQDKERMIALGASGERADNTGNLKFDHELIEVTEDGVDRLKHRYRIPDNLRLLVAGSTHQGEEQQLIAAYRDLLDRSDDALAMVLIPRHPERRREVQEILAKLSIPARLRSELTDDSPLLAAGEVLIGDTLGEVMDFYSMADLVFVGGSLVPVGGHNLLEAALVAKPVVFGPYIHNFREISAKLVAAGAGIKVDSQEQLVASCLAMLKDSSRRRIMGEAGRSLIVDNAGATQRTMTHISRYLNR